MALTNVLEILERSFKPTLLGLADSSQLRQRLNFYALEKKSVIEALSTLEAQDNAYAVWLKFRFFEDAYIHELSNPEAVTIEGEGSTKLADRKTMLAALAGQRDAANAAWNDLLTPETTATPKNQPTTSVPLEVVW